MPGCEIFTRTSLKYSCFPLNRYGTVGLFHQEKKSDAGEVFLLTNTWLLFKINYAEWLNPFTTVRGKQFHWFAELKGVIESFFYFFFAKKTQASVVSKTKTAIVRRAQRRRPQKTLIETQRWRPGEEARQSPDCVFHKTAAVLLHLLRWQV